MKALLVLTTFPNADTARQIGTVLVEKQLAACVNITPSVESIFRWKGEISRENEVLALIKTTGEAWPALEAEIRRLHPYEVPEIIALDVTRGFEPYLEWVREATADRDAGGL